jgi:hypothetical protein
VVAAFKKRDHAGHVDQHYSSERSPSTSATQNVLFASVFLHLMLLMADCRAIALPPGFHIDMCALGPALGPELDMLLKQLQSVLKRG